ncbi:hypothetical protein [Actinomycetospora termitidis]|uniref:Integral membrane protein n=1 Tax=Actinomycetospora termitidis TaxID=3053470 RepID=A0ABT7MJ67_9PSEU|nr:hypothetical protein [Actinomycetospora sp. Odt1-22]MDL5159403.1 hypothetical protein [Actinomycetospora sp. Odt1-22]
MPFRFQVGLPGPFVWSPRRSSGDGGLRYVTGPGLEPHERVALARDMYAGARRVYWVLGIGWTVWSWVFVVLWLTQGRPTFVGWSLVVWLIPIAVLALFVKGRHADMRREERDAGL